TEINLFGVYVAPISVMMVVAWFITIALRRIVNRFGLLRYVWHPALFVFAIYMIVLSSGILMSHGVRHDRHRSHTKARQGRRCSRSLPIGGARVAHAREASQTDHSVPPHPGDGDACGAARLGDVGSLYGSTVDARRDRARLCSHDGARGRGAHRRTARRRQ